MSPAGPDHNSPADAGDDRARRDDPATPASGQPPGGGDQRPQGGPARVNRAALIAVEFLVLLGFWLVLSGQFNALFIGMGVASAAVVTALSHEIVASSLGPAAGGVRDLPLRAWRFCGYGLWVLSQVPSAGLQIVYYVLHPRMPVEPCVLRFRTQLESQVARTMLANTITLIPGTLTVAVEGAEFTVHAFVPAFADDLVSAELQNRIGRVFLQDPEEPPEVQWERAEGGSREVVR